MEQYRINHVHRFSKSTNLIQLSVDYRHRVAQNPQTALLNAPIILLLRSSGM